MREWIKLSMPKPETAFLKAKQPLDGRAIPPNTTQGNVFDGEEKELNFKHNYWNFIFVVLVIRFDVIFF